MPNSSPMSSAVRSPKTRDGRADQAALHDHGGQSNTRHGQPDGALIEAVAIHHVEHARCSAGLHARDCPGSSQPTSPVSSRMRAQQRQRADRIGAPPCERRTPVRRQRLRQDEQRHRGHCRGSAPPRSRMAAADRHCPQARRARARTRSRRRRRRPACRTARRASRPASHRRCRRRTAEMLAAQMPEMMRPANSHHSVGASAIRI